MQSDENEELRSKMKRYWVEHTGESTLTEMMLDNDAAKISQLDIDDVSAMLPSLAGKRVLELGAGIGRYTGWLASKAEHVVTVDFIEEFIEKNRELHSSYGNIDFRCADATKLEFPPNSFDVVFSNWLLMYLNDTETISLLQDIMTWLCNGGYLFFRESCNRPSGSKRRGENPTIYRKLGDYDNILNGIIFPNPADRNHCFGYELLLVRSNQAYFDVKKNPFQLCWLAKKTSFVTSEVRNGCKSLHEFLDKHHFSNGIFFVKKKRDALLASNIKRLALEPSENVLDVGCGAGRASFYLAEVYNVRLHAIDLSANMIEQALESFDSKFKSHDIVFELADARKRQFQHGSFDAIYCQDMILHIANKSVVFDNFNKWLKSGGRLLVASLCKPAFERNVQDYLTKNHFYLNTSSEIKTMLAAAGFSAVEVFDESSDFCQQLENDNLDKSDEDGISAIINWIQSKHLEWMVFLAKKD